MTGLNKQLRVALATVLLWKGVFAQRSYVALGDSYASGVGAPPYDPASGDCRRSDQAYAPRIAPQLPASLDFQACSGARIPDVRGQLAALSPDTTDVTVSVGGNDAGFVRIITQCGSPTSPNGCTLSNCNLDEARQYIREVLPGELGGLYQEIRDAAPNATVYVVGYPYIYGVDDCDIETCLSRAELELFKELTDDMAVTLAGAAGAAGFTFIDSRGSFVGHELCTKDPYFNEVTIGLRGGNPGVNPESAHPNPAGWDAYTGIVGSCMTGGACA